MGNTHQSTAGYWITRNNPDKASKYIGFDKSITDIAYGCKIDYSDGSTKYVSLFHQTIKDKAYESLEYLTKNVKKLNVKFGIDTPLTYAIKQGDYRACYILLEYGDNFSQLTTPDNTGRYPLDLATKSSVLKYIESKHTQKIVEFLDNMKGYKLAAIHDEPTKEGEIACSICFENRVKVSFECGHCSCSACSKKMKDCWACKKPVKDVRPIFLN